MRVLHIIPGINRGGAEKILLELVKRKSSKMKYSILVLDSEGSLSAEFSLHCPSLFYANKNYFKALWWIYKNQDIDLIQSWLPRANIFGLISKLITRKKLIWNIGQMWPVKNVTKKSTYFLNKISGKLAFLADYYITCTRLSIPDYLKNGYTEDRFFYIPNGTSYKSENLLKKNSSIDIVNTCRLMPQKGLDLFISIAKYASKSDIPFHFHLYGDGPLRSHIKTSIQDVPNITLYQEKDLPESFYSQFDIFLSTSIMEGFSNSILEAMASALPILASEVGDNKLFLTAEQLIKDIKVEAIYKQLIYLSKRKKEIGTDNQKLVNKKYTSEIMVNSYENFYKQIAFES